ncbi:MAG: 3-deoxy-D-manno-octulosonic acid transferase [Cytophagales bacterium]|nr:MAG: 3-deoxy-D-manno-octulosonic acid transferase [Cytophagales bacterium]
MYFIYRLLLLLYTKTVYLVALLGNNKAKLFIKGRHKIFEKLAHQLQKRPPNTPTIWFHAASLGEFEQARPVIELCKTHFPTHWIVVSFFSPSGYEIRKDYANAHTITYLPFDSPQNARKFIQLINPQLILFAKYDFWYHYFREAHWQKIPLIVFSAVFRPKDWFFSPLNAWFLAVLRKVHHFFVQNESSAQCLQHQNISQYTIAGDTRFDYVAELRQNPKTFPLIETFCQKQPLWVIGSCWGGDWNILYPFINSNTLPLKIIVAPHEIHRPTIEKWQKQLQKNSLLYSQANAQNITEVDVLFLDNVGMLASIYQYAQYSYVGGGFGEGLHNILEPAVFGNAIIWGKDYKKFEEAYAIIDREGGFSVKNTEELQKVFELIYQNDALLTKIKQQNQSFILENTGSKWLILEKMKQAIE